MVAVSILPAISPSRAQDLAEYLPALCWEHPESLGTAIATWQIEWVDRHSGPRREVCCGKCLDFTLGYAYETWDGFAPPIPTRLPASREAVAA